jgi:hexosaminidase
MSALSEVLWSPKNLRNWEGFEPRLQQQFKRYDFWKVNYSKAYLNGEANVAETK